MDTLKNLNVLVYGATGSQAATVPTHLLQRGHHPFVLTRQADKAAGHARAGATVLEADINNADRLYQLSKGMDAVSLLLPFFADPAKVATFGRNVIDAAKRAGVKLLVWNASGFTPTERSGNPAIDVRMDILHHLQSSGLPFIVLQPTVYLENLLGPWTAPFVRNNQQVAYPTPADMTIGWIAADDVSALVVAALERPALAGSNWQISGLQNPDGFALAQAFSEGLERPVNYYAMPPQEFGQILDQTFGPGSGAAAAREYERMWQFPEQRPDFWVDMQPVLDKLPVRMTSITEWVAGHQRYFSGQNSPEVALNT